MCWRSIFLLFSLGLSACSGLPSETLQTIRPVEPPAAIEQPNSSQTGLASWYGATHQGKPTATGERFDMNQQTAAHRSLPLNVVVRVTNLENHKTIKVRINDRGPFVEGRIIDLSMAAATELGFKRIGIVRVRVEVFASDQTGAKLGQVAAEPK